MDQSRIEKNKREQNRVQMLRGAFQQLKELLPNNDNVKTKAEILGSAREYIKYLELRVQKIEERKARATAPDNYQARPSCRYAMVCLYCPVMLARQLELFKVLLRH